MWLHQHCNWPTLMNYELMPLESVIDKIQNHSPFAELSQDESNQMEERGTHTLLTVAPLDLETPLLQVTTRGNKGEIEHSSRLRMMCVTCVLRAWDVYELVSVVTMALFVQFFLMLVRTINLQWRVPGVVLSDAGCQDLAQYLGLAIINVSGLVAALYGAALFSILAISGRRLIWDWESRETHGSQLSNNSHCLLLFDCFLCQTRRLQARGAVSLRLSLYLLGLQVLTHRFPHSQTWWIAGMSLMFALYRILVNGL